MLICLGGLPGSGRQFLAHKLSTQLGFYYYDLDQKKFHKQIFDGQRRVKEITQRPRVKMGR